VNEWDRVAQRLAAAGLDPNDPIDPNASVTVARIECGHCFRQTAYIRDEQKPSRCYFCGRTFGGSRERST
jgi:hypothetical protein